MEPEDRFSLAVPNGWLPSTPAGRAELVMDLYRGAPVIDEDGEVIAYGPGLINAEQARRLLGLPGRAA